MISSKIPEKKSFVHLFVYLIKVNNIQSPSAESFQLQIHWTESNTMK